MFLRRIKGSVRPCPTVCGLAATPGAGCEGDLEAVGGGMWPAAAVPSSLSGVSWVACILNAGWPAAGLLCLSLGKVKFVPKLSRVLQPWIFDGPLLGDSGSQVSVYQKMLNSGKYRVLFVWHW